MSFNPGLMRCHCIYNCNKTFKCSQWNKNKRVRKNNYLIIKNNHEKKKKIRTAIYEAFLSLLQEVLYSRYHA